MFDLNIRPGAMVMHPLDKILMSYFQRVQDNALDEETGNRRAQQFAILMTMLSCEHRREPIKVASLARTWGMDRASMARLVDDLVKKGLVSKRPAKEVTSRGRQVEIVINDTEEIQEIKRMMLMLSGRPTSS